MGKKDRGGDLMTIAEFCRRVRISRSTYFSLQLTGLGPRTLKIGRAVRISERALRDWIGRMERGQAEAFNSRKIGEDRGDC